MKRKVNESKLTSENAPNRNYFEFAADTESEYEKQVMLWVSLQILDLYFIPYPLDNIDICFSNTVLVFNYFLLFYTENKVIKFRFEFSVK